MTLQQVVCEGSIADLRVSCGAPGGAAGRDIIYGGQNTYVTLTSSNVAYNGGTGQFTFDVTVTNLIEQPIGTEDGTTPTASGIRVFFASGPDVTGGAGTASVIPDGFGFFTAAAQPFYAYTDLLEQGETSASRAWSLVVTPTVTSFSFVVYIASSVEFDNGYVTLNGQLPGATHPLMHPGELSQLTAVQKTAVGNVVPASFTFGTSNPLCASVSLSGEITAVRATSCEIQVNTGSASGLIYVDVSGTQRVWDGSESADWSADGNWAAGLAPVAVDSVVVPTGVPNFPALVANTSIGGVTVDDGATLSLGAFDLTASANVATGGGTGGILGTGGRLVLAGSGTVHGILPQVLVSGTYTMDERLTAVATQQVDAGMLVNPGHQITVTAQ